ncbi:serine/threonine-protein kinase HAL4/sat4 [Mortierella sp. AM989]|nr:serine/threonine-protein kinase HAL4/sat4 [Mortierella sp. AM989]
MGFINNAPSSINPLEAPPQGTDTSNLHHDPSFNSIDNIPLRLEQLTLNSQTLAQESVQQGDYSTPSPLQSNQLVPEENVPSALKPKQFSLPSTPIIASTATMPDMPDMPDMPTPPAASHQPRQRHHTDQLDSRQRPSPHPVRSSISTRGRNGYNKSQLTTVIPSNPCTSAGLTSASPSSWSIASSETTPSSAGSSIIESKHRFEILPNGSHRHHLSAPKRHQFLSNQVRWLKELLEGKKDKEENTTPPHSQGPHQLKAEVFENPLSLLNERYQNLDADQTGSPAPSNRRKYSLKSDFVQKYGELQQQVVGKEGAFGTVRLSIKRNPETGEENVYAVKEFKYAHGETQKHYMRRLTSEFCIASSLTHPNVIQTMDLLQLHEDTYSEVMEYCAGGDLHSLIASANTLSEPESSCFFSQLMHGVAYLHSMGVVHRDLKPENLLLTSDGCLKIADFGNSEVFRMPWEKKVRSSASIRGSGPFIAPEEFTSETFDARKVDVWACGIIYMCMRLGKYNWYEAADGDPIWDGFLYKRDRILEQQHDGSHPDQAPSRINLTALEHALHISLSWPTHISDVIDRILEPDPRKRLQANHILDSEWLQHTENCHPTTRPPDQDLDESDFEPSIPSQRVGSKVVPMDTPTVTGCKIVKEARDRRDKPFES